VPVDRTGWDSTTQYRELLPGLQGTRFTLADCVDFETRPDPVLAPVELWEDTLTANASVLVLGK